MPPRALFVALVTPGRNLRSAVAMRSYGARHEDATVACAANLRDDEGSVAPLQSAKSNPFAVEPDRGVRSHPDAHITVARVQNDSRITHRRDDAVEFDDSTIIGDYAR